MVKIWNWIERKLWLILSIIIMGFIVMIASGCMGYDQRGELLNEVDQVQSKVADIALAVGKVDYQNDETMDILKALQAGNAASAPFNPYALPIGAGLTGIIAMLEALRRVEKGKRKYAEHELNNNKKNNHT